MFVLPGKEQSKEENEGKECNLNFGIVAFERTIFFKPQLNDVNNGPNAKKNIFLLARTFAKQTFKISNKTVLLS